MIASFLHNLEQDPDLRRSVCHREYSSPEAGKFRDLDPPLGEELAAGLRGLGVSRLYTHQAAAIEEVRAGRNVTVVTPTSSGKTLVYFLPVFESLLRGDEASALFLYPLKALEQDQRAKLHYWQEQLASRKRISVEVFDGDTPRSQRAKIKRNPPNILISNPDMLHQGILAYHQGWEKLLKRLRWLVIDELHAYRGIFGSHILQVFRRLSRLLAYHGVKPQFICLSATIANPLELAETLTGQRFTLIEQSGAPQSGKHLVLMNPKASTAGAVAKLFIRALDEDLKTIVFTKARVATEVIHRIVMETRPDLAPKVSSYRAGFLPEERRDIERRLASGELKGVVSTSALELGIDIGGLDVCILNGYPGSMMSFWQRAGRVGRRGEESAIVMVAASDALDQYFVARPQELLSRQFETALVNADNEDILRGHLPSAAAEIPLMAGDPHIDVERHAKVIASLEREGLLVRSAAGKHWFPGSRRPHANVSLRNVGSTFQVYREDERKPMAEISGAAVFRECHEGAIYLHRGEQHLVRELDLEQRRIAVQPVTTTIYTMARSDKQTEIIDDRECRQVRGFRVHVGKVKVTETYHSYERRRIYSQELLSVEPLDLPPQSYVTNGVWIEIPPHVPDVMAENDLHFMGGIHAVEHAAISLIPLFCLCDRNDVGGISFTRHKQLEGGAIFFYDGYPGGAGIAERTYAVIEELLTKTHSLIGECACEEGCPSCIQSPKCGSGNKPLDKEGALRVLSELLELTPRALARETPLAAQTVTREAEDEASEWTSQVIPSGKRVVVFDVETQRSADEVGGWSEARQMRLAVAAVWDSVTDEITAYDESRVEELLAHLRGADLVVGFNTRRFDYEVLRGYTFESLGSLPTLDLLECVEASLGRRLKLDTLARATLGSAKSADGLQSLAWFKEGRMDLVTEYCIHDVAITRDLLNFALQHGHLLYERSDLGVVRVPLEIELSLYMRSPEAVVA